jgi:TonB family protein
MHSAGPQVQQAPKISNFTKTPVRMKKFGLHKPLTVVLLAFTSLCMNGQSDRPAIAYGEANLVQDFLCSEIVYPENALKSGTEGTVIISFRVESSGKVNNIAIRQSVSPELDAEAVRVFRMLLWEPAISLGQPVASGAEFPVKFNIKKYEKHCRERGYVRTDPPFTPMDTSMVCYELSQIDKAPHAIFEEKGMTLGKFISKNIKYPELAYKQGISGKVSLRFLIVPLGRVSNIKVMEPVGGGCTQEALRLLSLLKWMPAVKSGLAVRCFTRLDIEFKVPDDSDMKMFENSQMNSN